MEKAIQERSFAFAIRVVKLCKYLQDEQKEYILTKQLMRSGTSIGANVAEAQQAQSRADFTAKLNIALKETSETKYWIRLMKETDYLTDPEAASILTDCCEIEKLLVTILKSLREK